MAGKENEEPNPSKKRRLSLSLKKRCGKASNEELVSSKQKPKSANSKRAHQWAFQVYENWISTTEDYELEDLWGEDKEKLKSMLCRFVLEARQVNGKHYTTKDVAATSVNSANSGV